MKEWIRLLSNGVHSNSKQETEINKNDYSRLDWDQIFDRLDVKDGKEDDRIPCNIFIQWMDTLNFQDSISLETKHGLDRAKLLQLAHQADLDNNGYIDRYEFKKLIKENTTKLEKIQNNQLLSYLRIVAYAEEYRWWPLPWFILTGTVFIICLYIFTEYFEDDFGEKIISNKLIFNPYRRYEIWRYFTYILLHQNSAHILLNLAMLFMVGLPLEMTHGTVRTQIVALSGAVTASLLFSVTNPRAYLKGCSGSVTSLVTAHLASIILNWREDTLILRQRFRNNEATTPVFGKPVRIARICLVVGILSVDIYNSCIELQTQTAYTAHLGGAVAGLCVGIIVLQNRKVLHWEWWMKCICIAAVIFYTILLIILNAVWSDGEYFPEQDYGPINKNP